MTLAIATSLGWNLSISLSAIGAFATFAWSAYQFLDVRARDSREREFQAYHKLIKELVQPESEES
jgi:hypothetical protein